MASSEASQKVLTSAEPNKHQRVELQGLLLVSDVPNLEGMDHMKCPLVLQDVSLLMRGNWRRSAGNSHPLRRCSVIRGSEVQAGASFFPSPSFP